MSTIDKNTYEENLNKFVEQISSQIDDMKSLMKDLGDKVDTELELKFEQLKTKKEKYLKILAEVKGTSTEKFEEMKGDFHKRVDSIEKEANEVIDHLKGRFSSLHEELMKK